MRPRVLAVAATRSEHAHEAECLGSVLELENMTCLHDGHVVGDDRDQVVRQLTCRFAAGEDGALKGKGLGNTHHYWRIRSQETFNSIPKEPFDVDDPAHNCVFTRKHGSESMRHWPMNLRIRARYLELYANIRQQLFEDKPYFALHWRRGDQMSTKCRFKRDKSVNCQGVEQMKGQIQAAFNKSGRVLPVYVATNEKRPATLEQLRHEGYLFRAGDDFNLTAMEAFFADIYLLGCAEHLLLPRQADTAVHSLVRAWRRLQAPAVCRKISAEIA